MLRIKDQWPELNMKNFVYNFLQSAVALTTSYEIEYTNNEYNEIDAVAIVPTKMDSLETR